MRVAFIGLRSIVDCAGGIESHVRELALRMAALDHAVTVFTRKLYQPREDFVHKNIRIISLPALYTKHLEALSHTALSIPLTLRNFDIVHIQACGPSLLSWVPRIFRCKVVVTVHGLDYMRAKWGHFAKYILKCGTWTAVHFPHETIVVSKVLYNYYMQKYMRRPVHIPNGVTFPILRHAKRIKRFGLEDHNYILYLGRLVPEKGAHHLILAFKLLKTDLKLVIAGGGTHSDAYILQLRRLAAGDDRIIFTGPLYGEDKDEAFTNAKLFVLPSELEGMPIVMLEAMSYSCPVLSSDIPECLEVISETDDSQPHASCFFTFHSGDVQSLQQQIALMLERADLPAFGEKARNFVLAHYDWDIITKKTLEVYRSVLEPRLHSWSAHIEKPASNHVHL